MRLSTEGAREHCKTTAPGRPSMAGIQHGSPVATLEESSCSSGHSVLTGSCFCRPALVPPSGTSLPTSRLHVHKLATASRKGSDSQPWGWGWVRGVEVGVGPSLHPKSLYCPLSFSQEAVVATSVPLGCFSPRLGAKLLLLVRSSSH